MWVAADVRPSAPHRPFRVSTTAASFGPECGRPISVPEGNLPQVAGDRESS